MIKYIPSELLVNKNYMTNHESTAIWIILAILAISVCVLSEKTEKLCNPSAYYGASEHIINPSCLPSDPKCSIEVCR